MNNVVGKTLIVLQLVFSLCFMCFAGAAYTFHAGWKKKALDFEQKANTFNTNLNDLKKAKDDEAIKFNADIAAMKTRAEAAEAKITGMETSLKQAQGSLANAEQQRDKHMADLIIAQQESESRIAETSDSRSEIKRLRDQVNEGIAQRRSLEDQLLERQGQLDEAQQRESQQLAKIAHLRDICRLNRVDPDEPVVGPVPVAVEKVNGVVKAAQKNASRTAELVEISVGSDDNISKKMRMFVTRGSKYICEIEVTDVQPQTAVGRVVEDTRNGNIERGDNVTTKL